MSIARFGDLRTRVLNSQSRRSDGSASSAESGMALAESATPSTAPSTVRAGNLPTSANESSEAEQIERLFSQFSDVDQVIILEVLEACGDAQIAASRLDDMRRANPLPPPKMCIVCEESPRATRFGCGHACCCQECTQRLMAMAEPRCPTCRAPVTKLSTGGGSMGALGVSVARQPTYAKPAEVAFDVNLDSVVSFGNAEPSGRIETPPRHRIETPPRHRIETPPRHRIETPPRHRIETPPRLRIETLWACWLLLFAGSLVMIILGALTVTGDVFVPGQHLCNFSVSDITCDKHEYGQHSIYDSKWTTVWPNANIVNGSRCPLYWGPYNEHGSKHDCTSKADELRQRYTSSDNATGTAQLVCWGPEWQQAVLSSLGHSQVCYTSAVPPVHRGTRSLIYWTLLILGPLLLCSAVVVIHHLWDYPELFE